MARKKTTQLDEALAARDTVTLLALLGDSVLQTSHVFNHRSTAPYLEGLKRNWEGRGEFSLRYEPTLVETGRWRVHAETFITLRRGPV